MDTPKMQRTFKWALWTGLVIMVLSILLLMFIKEERDDNPILQNLYNLLNDKGPLLFLLIAGVALPILEEFAFRFWGIGKRWAGIVSSVLMAGYFWRVFDSWIGAFVVLAVFLCIVFLVKERKTYLFIMMLLSSTLFMIAHKGNYSDFLLLAFGLMHKFGFALVTSYLVINHGMIWNILFHVANNTLICLLFVIFNMSFSPSTTFFAPDYEMTAKPTKSPNAEDEYIYHSEVLLEGDTVRFTNQSLENIAQQLLRATCDDPCDVTGNRVYRSINHDVELIHKKGADHKKNFVWAVKALADKGLIRLDTLYTKDYILIAPGQTLVEDSLKTEWNSKDYRIKCMPGTFNDSVANRLTEDYNASLSVEETIRNMAEMGYEMRLTDPHKPVIKVGTSQ